MKYLLFLFSSLLLTFNSFSQDTLQTFLAVKNTGVAEFHSLYPEYDGRGTIIFIFDTGVDMGVDGLTKTSTGEVKVIDVQDFSGEGDVQLFEADIDEEDGNEMFVNEDKNYSVFGAGKLTYQSLTGDYFIGAFEEERLKNSSPGVDDLNGNGKNDDVYYIVSFPTLVEQDTVWVAYFDTDGDGDLSDELPLMDYKIAQQSFHINNNTDLPLLTFALNIFPDEKKVSLHFDDGSHGTHVAGITSGYHIGGQNLNGIAPGAKVISCKLGNNLYAGGATVTESMKKSFLYADKISKEREEPVIINMSFGIGSEIEGKADMELFLDELLTNNPYLYVCVSNGNEGPGISTAGLPAANELVFSSGAALMEEVGRDLFGTSFNDDIILYFSSRGGEVSKPDIVSPGASTSTVPNWLNRDRFWGTSMASPYSAGVTSLLLSALKSEYPDVKVPAQLLFKAIRESGTKMSGYTHLDQGGGMINVMKAFELVKKYINDGEINKFETYSITSTAPNQPNQRARNLYIRDGSFLTGDETFLFSVKRNNFQGKKKFYRVYNIKSDSDWLIPIEKKTYLRNNQGTNISVKFDKSKMTEEGLYCGKIKAFRDDKSKFPEFEMLVTVVIPSEFNSSNNYAKQWNDKVIPAGKIDRYFIQMPAGQTSMRIKLSRDNDKYSMVRYRLFDPDGRKVDISNLLYSLDGDEEIEQYYFNLSPGVYELDVEGYFRATEDSYYNLEVDFRSVVNLSSSEIDMDNFNLNVVNEFNQVNRYNLSGEIYGYEVDHVIETNGKDYFEIPFTLNPGERNKEFEITLSKEDFNKVTDFSMMILDEEGYAVDKNGLTYRMGSVAVTNSDSNTESKYKLLLIPAFSNEAGDMTINVKETTRFENNADINVKFNNSRRLTLFPNIETTLSCSFDKASLQIPENAKALGKINFESQSNDNTEYELPLLINIH